MNCDNNSGFVVTHSKQDGDSQSGCFCPRQRQQDQSLTWTEIFCLTMTTSHDAASKHFLPLAADHWTVSVIWISCSEVAHWAVWDILLLKRNRKQGVVILYQGQSSSVYCICDWTRPKPKLHFSLKPGWPMNLQLRSEIQPLAVLVYLIKNSSDQYCYITTNNSRWSGVWEWQTQIVSSVFQQLSAYWFVFTTWRLGSVWPYSSLHFQQQQYFSEQNRFW